jgi:hypothetical protein
VTDIIEVERRFSSVKFTKWYMARAAILRGIGAIDLKM